MHELKDEKQSIGLHRGQVLTITDHHFGDADLIRPTQSLVQESIGFLSAFLRLQEVRLVKKLRIHLLKLDKIRDVDRMG